MKMFLITSFIGIVLLATMYFFVIYTILSSLESLMILTSKVLAGV